MNRWCRTGPQDTLPSALRNLEAERGSFLLKAAKEARLPGQAALSRRRTSFPAVEGGGPKRPAEQAECFAVGTLDLGWGEGGGSTGVLEDV